MFNLITVETYANGKIEQHRSFTDPAKAWHHAKTMAEIMRTTPATKDSYCVKVTDYRIPESSAANIRQN